MKAVLVTEPGHQRHVSDKTVLRKKCASGGAAAYPMARARVSRTAHPIGVRQPAHERNLSAVGKAGFTRRSRAQTVGDSASKRWHEIGISGSRGGTVAAKKARHTASRKPGRDGDIWRIRRTLLFDGMVKRGSGDGYIGMPCSPCTSGRVSGLVAGKRNVSSVSARR